MNPPPTLAGALFLFLGETLNANLPDEELTATEAVVISDFDDDIKETLLRALMGSECPHCAEDAHMALHYLGFIEGVTS